MVVSCLRAVKFLSFLPRDLAVPTTISCPAWHVVANAACIVGSSVCACLLSLDPPKRLDVALEEKCGTGVTSQIFALASGFQNKIAVWFLDNISPTAKPNMRGADDRQTSPTQ